MLSVDVNVLVYAFDESSPRHTTARSLLSRLATGPSTLLLFPTVISGFVRVVTDPRILRAPATADQAVGFITALLASPNVHLTGAEASAWTTFASLIDRYQLRGADVTDGLLAACAITSGAQWYSFDRGFARFTDLTWINPSDAPDPSMG